VPGEVIPQVRRRLHRVWECLWVMCDREKRAFPPLRAPVKRIRGQQDEIERLRAELTQRERDTKNQRRENDCQQRQIDGLQRQKDRLKQENEHLRRQLAAARRAGFRQAAPSAKNRP